MLARVFGLCAAVGAAVVLLSASSAAVATVSAEARIDVSTRAAVVHFLRSIHVDPRVAVIERGVRNYAGPNCPGQGWSCTSTAHTVVQIASSGGRNRFACSAARCSVVQISAPEAGLAGPATNTAICVKRVLLNRPQLSDIANGNAPGRLKQTCSITQSSAIGSNLAVVFQSIQPGLIKNATSTATISQTATGVSNGNTACVTQDISLSHSGKRKSFTANLNAHQTVSISQDATGLGANSAQFGATRVGNCDIAHPLTQSQTLTSVGRATDAVTQNENAVDRGPNLELDIEQNQGVGNGVASGANNASFVQTNTLTAIAKSTNGPVTQTQSSMGGGLLGTINQDSAGVSAADATQTEIQCEDASTNPLTHCDTADLDADEAPAALTQIQFGPVRKGVGTSTQTGNPADTFTINQSSTQNNDTGAGQTNEVQGDCSTDGTCTVTQTIDVGGQQTTNTESGQNINTTVTCTGSVCTGTPTTVLALNPLSDPIEASCTDSFASDVVTENVDLSQFDGQTIELRFSFATVDPRFNDFEGWYVKNIAVTGFQSESPVTVFSDSVPHGDTQFTASSDYGSAPGWHVTDRRSADFGGPAWWYGNETTGSFQSPGFTDACLDVGPNEGTITSVPFTLASDSHLSFDTLWEIEGVAPSSYDLMDVQVIPVLGG